MSEESTKKLTFSLSGIWLSAWLFTIGFADLGFWQGLLALLIWPYYVGGTVAP